jgi:hypothetical protein
MAPMSLADLLKHQTVDELVTRGNIPHSFDSGAGIQTAAIVIAMRELDATARRLDAAATRLHRGALAVAGVGLLVAVIGLLMKAA